MTLVKKANELWQPSEKPNLKVGETIDVTAYETLVREGNAVLVDEAGNELEMPGQMFTCPICFKEQDGLTPFYNHIATHLKKNQQTMEEAIKKIDESPKVEPVAKVVETLKADVAAEVAKQNAELKTAEPSVKEETPEEKAAAMKARRIEILAKARASKKAKK
jgi:hypothetical protein